MLQRLGLSEEGSISLAVVCFKAGGFLVVAAAIAAFVEMIIAAKARFTSKSGRGSADPQIRRPHRRRGARKPRPARNAVRPARRCGARGGEAAALLVRSGPIRTGGVRRIGGAGVAAPRAGARAGRRRGRRRGGRGLGRVSRWGTPRAPGTPHDRGLHTKAGSGILGA